MSEEDSYRPNFAPLALDEPDPAEVIATVRERLHARSRRRRQMSVLGAVAAVAAVGTVAVLAQGLAPSTNVPTAGTDTAVDDPAVLSPNARCYTSADLSVVEPPLNYMTISIASQTEGEVTPIAQDAMSECADLWQRGMLSADGAAPTDTLELTTCLLPPDISDDRTLEVAVFPGDSGTCARLGLQSYN